jgi:DNA polymerase I-like protein with 3'-5' exonuclease and polymerase domains
MKRALVQLAERLPTEAQILAAVDDEVLVEVQESKVAELCDLGQSTMIEAMATVFLQVPIEVETGVCALWGEK